MSFHTLSVFKSRKVVALVSAASFVAATFVGAQSSSAAPTAKPGSACIKANATTQSGAITLTCTKVNGKLVWSALAKKPATPTPVATATPVATPTKPTPSPQAGGTLNVGVASIPAGKGNPFLGIGQPSIYTFAAIYDPLVIVNDAGKTIPALATSWKMTDSKTWQFTLREGVTFSNGEKFDAGAVVDAFTYLTSDAVGSKTVVAAEISNIESVSGSGNTVTMKTKTPDAILPRKLSVVWIPAPEAWKSLGSAAFALAPVGTGPFKVEKWEATTITMSANKTSWHAPKVDSFVISAVSDPTARLQALQSGQLDLAVQLGPDEIEQVDPKKTDTYIDSFPQVMSLAYITTKPNSTSPLMKQDVRLALNYAVNREAIVKSLLSGKGTAANQGSTKLVFGYNTMLAPYPYDVAKAKALLASAGYPTGFTISADVTVGSFPADADIYQALQRDLRKVGVTLLLRQIPFAEWLTKYNTLGWAGEAFGLSWNSNTLDARRAIGLFSCSGPGKFFCNAEMTPVLEAIDSSLDEAKREELLFQAAEINYKNPPALYLVGQIDVNLTSSNVRGFNSVNRYFSYDKMTVKIA